MSTTYLITGANRGIGLEFAKQLSQRGEHVIATARDPEQAQELQQLDVRLESLDVRHPPSIRSLIQTLGAQPIDVLINDAGIGVGRETLGELDYDRFERFFKVNSLGPLRVTEALLPNLRAGGRRVVASLTSKMGSIGDNTSGNAYAYRASKAALNALNRSLAIDLASEGFTCLVLHPGWVETDMGGAGAPVTTEASVGGLLKVLDRAKPKDSGEFFDFSGASVPW